MLAPIKQLCPLVCTVTYRQDMAHYMPSYEWHGHSRKDLESSIYNEIWDNVKNDIDIFYDTKDGITCRWFKPKIKTKTVKIKNVYVKIMLK